MSRTPTPRIPLMLAVLAACSSDLSVVDDQGAPVAGAEVFVDCTLAGTTDANGQIKLNASPGASIAVRKLVDTGSTAKALHDDWAWHTYVTNVVQEDNGAQTDDTVGPSGEMPQVVLSQDNAMIGLHLVGVSEIDLSRAAGTSILDSWGLASPYLFDVTDGQMYVERFDLYEDASLDDADFRYAISVWPGGGGPTGPTTYTKRGVRMNMPVQGFDGGGYSPGSWTTQNGFRTAIHELGHLTFDAHDEYWKIVGGKQLPATCTDPAPVAPEQPDHASMMWSQYVTSEMCGDDVHSTEPTFHELHAHDSVWGRFETVWEGDRYNIKTPMDRGDVVNPGPDSLHCMASYSGELHIDDSSVCEYVTVIASLPDGSPAAGARVTLDDGTKLVEQGKTDALGRAYVYGASPGDSIDIVTGYLSGSLLNITSGGVTVGESCEESVTLEVYEDVIPVIPWPEYEPDIFRIVFGDPRDIFGGIEVWLSQGGPDIDPVPVSRDELTGNLYAEIRVNQELPLEFRLAYRMEGAPAQVFETTFRAASLQAPTLEGGAQPEVWTPFGVDGPGIALAPGVVPEGSLAAFGQTVAPLPPPEGSLFVGGPWALSLPDDLSVPFSAPVDRSSLCGADPEQLSLVRATDGRWVEVEASLEPDRAHGELSDGIYALVASSSSNSCR